MSGRKDMRMGTDAMDPRRPERAASPTPRLSINALTPVETEAAVEDVGAGGIAFA